MLLRYAITLLATAAVVSSYKSPYHDPHFEGDRSVIVQMFEWRFDDLAKECEEFLGPNGYGAIQVSPPVNEHAIIDGPWYNKEVRFPWYQRYQTVSYSLNKTRSGTREELENMVERCNKANVRVYVDIVLNHMTGSGSPASIGSSGSYYDANNYTYPGVPFNKSHFNDGKKCGTSDGVMHNIEDPWQTRNCELVGLRDLNQDIKYVRDKQIDHLNELIDMGVAGFRVDASKHMYPRTMLQTWQALKPLRSDVFGSGEPAPFFYHEAVLPFKGSPTTEKVPGVGIDDYTKLGRILNFGNMHNIADVLKKKNNMNLSKLKNFGPAWDAMLPDEDSVNIVDNHDVQRYSENVLSFHDRKLSGLANIFMLSWPYGVAKVMSSYGWERNIDGKEDKNSWWGPPHEDDETFTTKRVTINTHGQCNDRWICEHRWPEIQGMTGFRNAAGDARVASWWDDGSDQIAFARSGKAFIAINNDDSKDMDQVLQTTLPAGQYVNVINGETVVVRADGQAKIQIKADNPVPVVAFHIKSKK